MTETKGFHLVRRPEGSVSRCERVVVDGKGHPYFALTRLYERLHFQILWLSPNASWLDQIEIWFSVREPQTLAAQSLCEYDRSGNVSARLHRLLQPNGQADQLDLYGREA